MKSEKEGTSPILTIGVAGKSSSGKTFVLSQVKRFFKDFPVSKLDLDGYHFHDREQRALRREYPEELAANDFGKIISHIQRLKIGESVVSPTYDHESGKFGSCVEVNPGKILFIEGLHSGLVNEMAGKTLIDLSLFINPSEALRTFWKKKRDVNERGYSRKESLSQIKERKEFEKEFIEPQMCQSNLIYKVRRSGGGGLSEKIYCETKLICDIGNSLSKLGVRFVKSRPVCNKTNYSEARLLDNIPSVESCFASILCRNSFVLATKAYSDGEIKQAVYILVLILLAILDKRISMEGK